MINKGYNKIMDNELLIYMDCCCLNRPYDNQIQDKIRIESNTIMAILFKCFYGKWKLIGSDILEYEIRKTPDINKRNNVLNLYSIKKEVVLLNNEIQNRALELQNNYRLKSLDSLHYASTEYRKANTLLTVDKNFILAARKIPASIMIENPVNWFMEVMIDE
jgi:predicted nucleic acid-binding protein